MSSTAKTFINSFEPENAQKNLKTREKEEEKSAQIKTSTTTIASVEIKNETIVTKELNNSITKNESTKSDTIKEKLSVQESLKIEKPTPAASEPSKPVEITVSTVETLLKKDKLITEITKNVQKREKSLSPKARNDRRGDRSSSRNRRRSSNDRDRVRRTNRSNSRDRRGANRSRSRSRRRDDRDRSRNRYNRRVSSRERLVNEI